MIMVSIVGFYAIRPIERAQDETLEELTGGAEGDPDTHTAGRIEDAIEAEARV